MEKSIHFSTLFVCVLEMFIVAVVSEVVEFIVTYGDAAFIGSPLKSSVGITGAANATRTGSNTEHTPASSVAPTAAESTTPACLRFALAPQFTLVQLLPLRLAISLTAT